MKKYKCKPCKGIGKIYHSASIISEVPDLDQPHVVKSFEECCNCDGTGLTVG